MKIADVRAGMNNVGLEAKVVDKSEVRNVQTKYGPRNVADAILEDETGQISLSLWENNIALVDIGNTVVVTDAYVTQFKDKMQLNIPKTGKLEVK